MIDHCSMLGVGALPLATFADPRVIESKLVEGLSRVIVPVEPEDAAAAA
jgi:hypothetical protein